MAALLRDPFDPARVIAQSQLGWKLSLPRQQHPDQPLAVLLARRDSPPVPLSRADAPANDRNPDRAERRHLGERRKGARANGVQTWTRGVARDLGVQLRLVLCSKLLGGLVAAPELEVLGSVERGWRNVVVLEDDDGRAKDSEGEKGVDDESRVEGLQL